MTSSTGHCNWFLDTLTFSADPFVYFHLELLAGRTNVRGGVVTLVLVMTYPVEQCTVGEYLAMNRWTVWHSVTATMATEMARWITGGHGHWWPAGQSISFPTVTSSTANIMSSLPIYYWNSTQIYQIKNLKLCTRVAYISISISLSSCNMLLKHISMSLFMFLVFMAGWAVTSSMCLCLTCKLTSVMIQCKFPSHLRPK